MSATLNDKLDFNKNMILFKSFIGIILLIVNALLPSFHRLFMLSEKKYLTTQ